MASRIKGKTNNNNVKEEIRESLETLQAEDAHEMNDEGAQQFVEGSDGFASQLAGSLDERLS